MKTRIALGFVMVLMMASFACTVHATVIAEWRFEGNTGSAGFLADSSGNGHNLTGNAIAGLPGYVGPAPSPSGTFALFGGGESLSVPLDLSAERHIKISLWLNNGIPNSSGGTRIVFETGDNFLTVNSGIAMVLNEDGAGGGRAYLTTSGDARTDKFSHNNPSASWTGIWEFYELEYNLDAGTNSDVVKVFKNGVLVGTDYSFNGTLFSGMFNGTLHIGGPRLSLYGGIDNFKIESIPEPTTIAILSLGVFVLRKRR